MVSIVLCTAEPHEDGIDLDGLGRIVVAGAADPEG